MVSQGSYVPGLGWLKAFISPKPGVQRPLQITTSDGPMPVVVLYPNGDSYRTMRVTEDGYALTHNHPHAGRGVSFHMTRDTGVSDTLAAPATKNTRTIQVSTPASWAGGNKIEIPGELDTCTIKVIDGADVTLDRLLDQDHVAGTTIGGRDVNMARAATLEAPYSYRWPHAGQLSKSWHIHGINMTFSGSEEPTLDRFGSEEALTYGVQFRKVSPTLGEYSTYWVPFRTLNALLLSGAELQIFDKASATWYCHLFIDFTKLSNWVIEIDAEAGEYLEMVLPEANNTDNATMEVKLDVHQTEID